MIIEVNSREFEIISRTFLIGSNHYSTSHYSKCSWKDTHHVEMYGNLMCKIQQICGIKYRKFLVNGFHLVRQIQNTEFFFKIDTHLAEKIQKFCWKKVPISRKKYSKFLKNKPIYSLASRTARHRKCPPPPGLCVYCATVLKEVIYVCCRLNVQ